MFIMCLVFGLLFGIIGIFINSFGLMFLGGMLWGAIIYEAIELIVGIFDIFLKKRSGKIDE